MPVYQSHRLLGQLEENVTRLLDVAIGTWQLLPHHQFAKRPGQDAWSANECLQHLNSYSRFYLPAMEQAIQSAPPMDVDTSFKTGWLGHFFTKMMLPAENGTIKKMKSPKGHAPVNIPASAGVIAEFIDHQEKLLRLHDQARNVDLNIAKTPISISRFIRLKLGDTFLFFIAHQMRHFNQAQAALGLATEKIQVFPVLSVAI